MAVLFQNKYRIASNRLEGYDYGSDGFYFITICTKNREEYFGKVVNGEMLCNEMGKIAQKYWTEIPKHFDFVLLDEWVVMPNHVHGVLMIDKNRNRVNGDMGEVKKRQRLFSAGSYCQSTNRFQNQGKGTISSIVGSYKSICTKMINKIKPFGYFGWQPNYYDNIIRDEIALNNIRKYIQNNPIKWEIDRNNKENVYM